MLMDLRTLEWDDELLQLFDIPRAMLPAIRASSDPASYGSHAADRTGRGEVPVSGALGDQQAATVGQVCTRPGEAKNTYGTGNFMLLNTGREIVPSKAGPADDGVLQAGRRGRRSTRSKDRSPSPDPRCSGCAISSASSSRRRRSRRSRSPSRTPAACISCRRSPGLFAPYWRSDARGAIVGLSRFNTKAHLARATLEAICFQTRAVLDAMVKDSGVRLELLKVDGGATVNDTLMQLQADILGVPVVRPVVAETTALGAAYAAGLATGFWKDLDDLRAELEGRSAVGAALDARPARASYAAGRRRSSGRSIGWMWVKASRYPLPAHSSSELELPAAKRLS